MPITQKLPLRWQTVVMGVLILIVAAAFLISRATALTMGYSELSSIFHTSGTFQQVLDPDLPWRPGFYVVLYGWQQLVGQHEFAVKMLCVLTGLLTVAMLVQVGKRAGWQPSLLQRLVTRPKRWSKAMKRLLLLPNALHNALGAALPGIAQCLLLRCGGDPRAQTRIIIQTA